MTPQVYVTSYPPVKYVPKDPLDRLIFTILLAALAEQDPANVRMHTQHTARASHAKRALLAGAARKWVASSRFGYYAEGLRLSPVMLRRLTPAQARTALEVVDGEAYTKQGDQ